MDVAIKVLYGILPEYQPYIEDIYDSLEEAQKIHPDQQIMVGYGIVDNTTGFLLNNTEDWYSTYKEVQAALTKLTA